MKDLDRMPKDDKRNKISDFTKLNPSWTLSSQPRIQARPVRTKLSLPRPINPTAPLPLLSSPLHPTRARVFRPFPELGVGERAIHGGADRERPPPGVPLRSESAGRRHLLPAHARRHPPLRPRRGRLRVRAPRPRRPLPPHDENRGPLLLHHLQAPAAEGGQIDQGRARRRPRVLAHAGPRHGRRRRRGRQEAAVQDGRQVHRLLHHLLQLLAGHRRRRQAVRALQDLRLAQGAPGIGCLRLRAATSA
jgi:hypothetical protein